MRRSHVLVLIEFSLDEDNFFSALIGVWTTVTKNDWLRLRLLPRETFFFFKTFFANETILGQTCLGVPRWPRLYCFAVQVCFAFSRLCFVNIFG